MAKQWQYHLLTCHHTVPAACLVHIPNDGLFNQKHVALPLSEAVATCCVSTDDLTFFPLLTYASGYKPVNFGHQKVLSVIKKEGGHKVIPRDPRINIHFQHFCFSSRPLLSSVTFCSSRSRWPIACWYCGFESRQGYERVSLVIVVFCEAEVSATDRSLIQRSPTDCAVFECDREASILRRPWPPRGLLGQARKVPIAVI